MSKENLKAKAIEKGDSKSPGGELKRQEVEAKPTVFHRCTCPKCGEDNLNLFDFGVFLSGDFLGMTSEGELGCGRLELDGDYQYVVACRSCGHEAHNDLSRSNEQLLEWAIAHGKELEILTFSCPICESTGLCEHWTDVELFREVVAVYTIPGDSETDRQAEIALLPTREIYHSAAPRYRCREGHELAKDDGTPVETKEELVEWLKAHSTHEKG